MSKSSISRRDFMRTSAGAAGMAMAAKSVVLEAAPIPAQPVAAADRVRFGIIGVGMQGSGLLRTSIDLPGVECAAVCDLYDGRVQLGKEIVGKPVLASKRYQDLLESRDLDCIIAAVPDHWHKQIVVDCCNAGKDVYCEKPMTHKVSEGFEMIAAEQKNNRIVQIGSQRRSSITFAKAKEIVESGAIGEVCLVEAGMGRNDPCGAWQYAIPPDLSPQTVDWDTWLGTAPKRPFDKLRWTRWRCYQDYGEGVPGDLFVHLLTGIHYVMGIAAPPSRALSSGGLFRWKDGRDVPDTMTTIYEYPNFSATLRVTLNTETPEYMRLMGSGGMIELRDGGVSASVYLQDGENHEPCAPGWPKEMKSKFVEQWHTDNDPKPASQALLESTTYFVPPHYDDDREHLWNYFQSVRTRRPSVEDATFGNNTAIGCHMANYSYFQKSPAVWDADAKTIKG